MPFNFAEFAARGAQIRDARNQAALDNSFRQEQADLAQANFAKSFAAAETQRALDNAFRGTRFDEETRRFNTTFQAGRDDAERNFGLSDRRVDLAEDQFGLLEDQFVDIAGPNGQTGSINIRDLLGDQRARAQLSLQRRAQDFAQSPLDLSHLSAFSDARTGDFSSLPSQVGIREAQAFGIPSIGVGLTADGSFAESESRRNAGIVEGTREGLEFFDDNIRPVDSSVFQREQGFLPFLGRAFRTAGAATSPGGLSALRNEGQQRRALQTAEFTNLRSNVEAVGDIFDALPADAEPAALARTAPQINAILQDATLALQDSDLSKTSKDQLAASLVNASRDFLSKLNPGDPVVAALRQDIEKAARKGKNKDVIAASKAITEYMATLSAGNQ